MTAHNDTDELVERLADVIEGSEHLPAHPSDQVNRWAARGIAADLAPVIKALVETAREEEKAKHKAVFDVLVQMKALRDKAGAALVEQIADILPLMNARDALAAQVAAVLALADEQDADAERDGRYPGELTTGQLRAAVSAEGVAAHNRAVWDEGKRAGFSVAMRRMSDEPKAPEPVNPYKEEA